MSRSKNSLERQTTRLLRFLNEFGSARPTSFCNDGGGDNQTLLVPSQWPQRQMVVNNDVLNQALSQDLAILGKDTCSITQSGRAHLRRGQHLGVAENRFAEQHRQMTTETVVLDGQRHSVRRNLNESPLSKLRQRRTKDGNPFINDAAFYAGERLRADFTRAQMMPSVTSNWNAAMGGGQRRDGQGGKVALSDNAMDAQDRFNRALKCVGPDLSDVLIDVCCYLKGLQQVEREQGWPPRSAKLMLRTGLGLLARYYGTVPGERASA